MNEINDVLSSIRKSFAFLWDDYGFHLLAYTPQTAPRDAGYYVQLANKWCLVAFQSESAYLDDIGVVPNGLPAGGCFVSRWAMLSTGEEEKPLQLPYTAENVFNSAAEFARPYLIELLELAKDPSLFESRWKALMEVHQSRTITIDMIRAERTRLHSLGLQSSLGAAIENLQKRAKSE